MALKDLERYARELEHLRELLRFETRRFSRLVIIQRVQEIVDAIEEDIDGE